MFHAIGRLGVFLVVETFIRRRGDKDKLTKNKIKIRDSTSKRSRMAESKIEKNVNVCHS